MLWSMNQGFTILEKNETIRSEFRSMTMRTNLSRRECIAVAAKAAQKAGVS